MTKQELITALSPALLQKGYAPTDVQNVLETYTVPELQAMFRKHHNSTEHQLLEQIRAEARQKHLNDPEVIRRQEETARQAEETYREYYLTQIFRTVIQGRVPVRNKASEEIVIGWLHPGENLNAEWFIAIIQDPKLSSQLQWKSADSLDPQKIKQAKAAQLEQDRKTFSEAARQFQVSDNIANFNLVRQTLGEGFSVNQIQSVVGLAPATKEEIDKWNAEAIVKRQDFLINRATPDQLKAAARDESAASQQAIQDEQARLQLESQQQRESTMGFPRMPSNITLERIKAASPSELKFWMKKYGHFQLNSRIAGRE